MIWPDSFGFNEETAESNVFQNRTPEIPQRLLNAKAIGEFECMVEILEKNGIAVHVKQQPKDVVLPDAVFPNNWVSFLPDGKIVLYPMMMPSRRREKNRTMIDEVASESGYHVKEVIDLGYFESEGRFLEGTGSLVLDHRKRKAFASISPRTDAELVRYFCELTGYQPVIFHALDNSGTPVYHTNVMMALASDVAVVCMDCIRDPQELKNVWKSLEDDNYKIVYLDFNQVKSFAANILELQNKTGEKLLVLSQSAFESLHSVQKRQLEASHKLVVFPVPVIEKTGGGSVRCMLTEIFRSGY